MGGQSTVYGTLKHDHQRNSRVGETVSVPINRQQSLKFSYSTGVYIAIGKDYRNISAGS